MKDREKQMGWRRSFVQRLREDEAKIDIGVVWGRSTIGWWLKGADRGNKVVKGRMVGGNEVIRDWHNQIKDA